MKKKFDFENTIKSKTVAGIEIILLSDHSFEINCVVFKKNKSVLQIEKQREGIKTIEELINYVDVHLPVVLVVNGKGIIHRKVSFSENDTISTLLNKVLPNANNNEFYFQETEIHSTQKFISIVRAVAIDELVEELKKNKFTNIVACLLGPFVANNLISLIDPNLIDNEYWSFGTYQLQIREQRITELSMVDANSTNTKILIGEDSIAQKLLIPFAAGLSYFVGTENGIQNSVAIDFLKTEYKQKQKFQFFSWVLVILSLIILMGNYSIFNHYWNKGNEMNAQLLLNQSALSRFDTLKKEVAQKKEFLEQNGLLENSKTSFYADRLAASLPSSIQLTEMNIHPLKKKQANDVSDGFSFDTKIINLTGNCERSTDLNDWMKDIQLKSWIADVTLVNYRQDKEIDKGLFLLEIKLK